ncbi:hypothetical protein OUZ56_007495 [Daphnia magna]|uniref:Uncharacterized protein n=1 Tax=Daphnia magna TaxID=35525 RepID=A0ABR0AA41_9CRUS|nr:hypothetical protein OUZ56_007495 [Daphnia magna]
MAFQSPTTRNEPHKRVGTTSGNNNRRRIDCLAVASRSATVRTPDGDPPPGDPGVANSEGQPWGPCLMS